MSEPFIAACIQHTAGPDPEPNLRVVGDLIRRARDSGADLIMTPGEQPDRERRGGATRRGARRTPFLAGMLNGARTGGVAVARSLVIDPRAAGADPGEAARNRSF